MLPSQTSPVQLRFTKADTAQAPAKHPGALGALLMGYYDKNDFIFAGKVGTGFSHSEGHALLTKLKKLEQKDPPFKSIPRLARKGAVFAKPELVAHVNFTEWTHDGVMRHPSFQGLREDKPAPEVVREKEKAPPVKKATTSKKKQATKAADEVSLKLESLRAEVEAMIVTKVAERRQELQSQLSELLEITGHGNGTRRGRGKARRAAAKYRNPKNADEVWSGRGRMPLWLGAEIKAGKDREDFLVG
jgi:DNA-binding protein H-NS